jgi:hypothetical protein
MWRLATLPHDRPTEISRAPCRVFLARLLMVHGERAPEVLRRMADELKWLQEDTRRKEQEPVALELHFVRSRWNS